MNFPKDPIMLYSVVNTALRDHYSSLDELCSANGVDRAEIEQKLKAAGFTYMPEQNCFR